MSDANRHASALTQEQAFKEAFAPDWPNCSTPDCENKVCVWATATLCAPCSLSLVGPDEMIRRWNATHDEPWDMPFAPGDTRSIR